MSERTVTLIDDERQAHPGTFRPVRELGTDCVSGVTQIEDEDFGTLFVATILHADRVFTYHDWQAPHPEEIALDPEATGRWLDNESDAPAVWMDGKPYLFNERIGL